MELYLPLNPNKSRLNSIIKCLVDIKNWMAQNIIQLNEDKTEIFFIWLCQFLCKFF